VPTIIALVTFVVIGAFQYIAVRWTYELGWYFAGIDPSKSIIPDVRLPWFMLGVIYAGLFFLLADRKERR